MFLQGETPDPGDIFGKQISLGKCVWGHTFPGRWNTHHCNTGMMDRDQGQKWLADWQLHITLHRTTDAGPANVRYFRN